LYRREGGIIMKFNIKIVFVLILVLSLVIFTSCSQEEVPPDEPEESMENTNPEVEEDEEEPNSHEEETEEDVNEDEPVSIEIETPEESEIITDSGTYVGEVDNNHIEIKISGVPEEISAKVFRIDEDIKNTIQNEISADDQVKFEYYLNEDDVGVIVSIEKIEN
jgi:sporulation protein YlmC with PRC-barrel domain